ncbi:allulose-6-phosphate 3-epimerase, partial [Streptococcus pneumoniae]|nr:allulose-6-phosphate 3-epimerase [Streptococcus pneumoniae]
GLFGLDDDIAKDWDICYRDYEEMTGKTMPIK